MDELRAKRTANFEARTVQNCVKLYNRPELVENIMCDFNMAILSLYLHLEPFERGTFDIISSHYWDCNKNIISLSPPFLHGEGGGCVSNAPCIRAWIEL